MVWDPLEVSRYTPVIQLEGEEVEGEEVEVAEFLFFIAPPTAPPMITARMTMATMTTMVIFLVR